MRGCGGRQWPVQRRWGCGHGGGGGGRVMGMALGGGGRVPVPPMSTAHRSGPSRASQSHEERRFLWPSFCAFVWTPPCPRTPTAGLPCTGPALPRGGPACTPSPAVCVQDDSCNEGVILRHFCWGTRGPLGPKDPPPPTGPNRFGGGEGSPLLDPSTPIQSGLHPPLGGGTCCMQTQWSIDRPVL